MQLFFNAYSNTQSLMSFRAPVLLSIVRFLSAVALGFFAGNVFAEDWMDAIPPSRSCTAAMPPLLSDRFLFERDKLTGDWCGTRSAFAEQGMTFDVSTTQFYQGVTLGGLSPQFQYGGRNDYFLRLDGENAGIWEGGTLTVHGESRYGESANTITGALSPVNLMLSVPLSSGTANGVTGVKFAQTVSTHMQVYAGKLNTLDDYKQPLTGAGPLTGFQNSALIYNPVYARTVPYSALGAGMIYTTSNEQVIELVIYDTNNTPTVNGFNTLFNNGATIYASGTVPTKFFDRPGHQGVSGTCSTGTYTDLTPTAFLDPTAGLVLLSTPATGSWCVTYSGDQAIYVSPDDPKKMWGLFCNLGIADNNPSPVRCFASTGISGASPIEKRQSDSFGMAWFYLGLSDSLKNSATGLRALRDEIGVELYYNVAVTPWFQISPDVQVISPCRERSNDSLLIGLRAKVDF